ncbi:hypothetical protein pneo_cds_728 [Pandoravirus neocaledonia]|uniref:Uncharacterized protein n=1 Tax=Pandoravirus neocaledonia TaxID=2107708 RepID=A0A2U7UDA1_9VIRU|nr:hypothetical protein pneo_cds_728 [Pandoravirus neocaledonia]AVK76335.1 hypothetical protein pneo_cds_728 [Pandoravirus neocaledonia]
MAKAADSGSDTHSLDDMPREIIDSIVSWLQSGHDVASFSTAIGQNALYWMLKHMRVRPLAWLRAGAPIEAVTALLERDLPDGQSLSFQWAEAAASGGRLDVFMYLHALAGVDVAYQVRLYGWARMKRKRRRPIFEKMRALLKAAVVGRGGLDVIGYILCLYDPPYFRPRRLFNSGILIRLSRHAINHRHDALNVLEALHSRDKRGKCGCTSKLAYDAARADRPDILEWMVDYGCSATADAVQTTRLTAVERITYDKPRGRYTTVHRHASPWSTVWDGIALAAVRARAAATLAWIAPKADRARLVDAISRLDDRTYRDRIDLIVCGALAGTALRLFFEAVFDLAMRPKIAWMTTPWRLILLGAMVACAAAKMRKAS